MTSSESIVVAGVGDIGLMRDDPASGFTLVASILREADISFAQLERILSTGRTDPKWTMVLPWNADEFGRALRDAGFDVISVAGNHHMDAGVDAMLDTVATLRKHGIEPLGVGANLAEARAPVIIERKGTRVAFLGYSSILPRGSAPYEATENRPGCAPMFINTYYEQIDWQPGTPPRIITKADGADLAAMVQSVKKAKALADVVIVSIHWGIHVIPAMIAMYEYEVGHAAIDAGADLIFGHHAHILKGIEVYKGKVIFHNLGNFAHDRPRLVKKPDIIGRFVGSPIMYDRFGPGSNGHYPFEQDARKTIIAKCQIRSGQIQQVSFVPCMIREGGEPEPLTHGDQRFDQVVEYVKSITADQGLTTTFSRSGDEVVVELGPADMSSTPVAMSVTSAPA